ncbi:MAG TPA: polysaccharide biosynthesis protein [Solirubrobacteraceae bacterium]|nr:polysaccharide biosynthesis protein [Solirubrobacteraceae bacterium]
MNGAHVLVTGSGGFIGQRVVGLLTAHWAWPVSCEPPDRCVLDPRLLPEADWCIHLAAHKYATTAEDAPAHVADLNIRGTQNVVDRYGPNVVLASTCKAADPMTVYGASKLIAERVVLNAGGRVVRLVNVIGSTGSVVEQWAQLPEHAPVPVTDCYRMWMTRREAARLLLAATAWPSGRYALDLPGPEPVFAMAARLHPGRPTVRVPLRRGDRRVERLVAESEIAEPWVPGVIRIEHPADT